MIGKDRENRKKRRIRVVLADDHHFTRMVLRDIINRSADIHVIGEASTGEEALAVTRSLNPDVLVLDMEMQGMNGIDVVRTLQHEKQAPACRIVALSAHNDRQFILAVLEMGVDNYIIKDEPIRNILEAIRQCAFSNRTAIHHPLSI